MTRFSEEDKIRLYIVRAAAEELGVGSWDDCTTIFNHMASCHRSQDGLTYQYNCIKKGKSNRKTETKARTAAWAATQEQVRKWLLEASPMRYS